MSTQSSRLLFAACAVLVLATIVAAARAGPSYAREAQPDSPLTTPSIDYALLNQPGPLWLPGANFGGAKLFAVDLAGANLREANFDGASLARANLSGALLTLATLRNANLILANLQDATLSLADLRSANLAGADLSGAQMQGAMLGGANMNGAQLSGADLRQSEMQQAGLRSADLNGAQLAGSNLQGADLTGADLSRADLSSVNLAGASLEGAELEGVTYDPVTVWPANFDLRTMAVNASPSDAAAQEMAGERDLSIAMTLTPAMAPWFNQVARPQDMSLIDRPQQIPLLDDVHVGDKMVVFKSVDMAETLVPQIADKFDIIGYNLEHGPLTPFHEQEDPIGSVQRMRALADTFGLRLALGPDHDFALSHGTAMAPYVDIYAMQVQRVQSQPDVVREFVVPMAAAVRAANPAIETSLQVRSEGEAEQIATLIDSVRQSIDGVAILSSPETVETAKELVELLQKGEPTQVHLPEPAASSAPEPNISQSPSWWLLIWGMALQLLVIGFIVLFVLFAEKVVGSHRRYT